MKSGLRCQAGKLDLGLAVAVEMVELTVAFYTVAAAVVVFVAVAAAVVAVVAAAVAVVVVVAAVAAVVVVDAAVDSFLYFGDLQIHSGDLCAGTLETLVAGAQWWQLC